MTTELKVLAKDWGWLIDLDQFTFLQTSPFGDLFLRDSTGAFCLLDINLGELQYATVAGSDPALLFPVAFDMTTAADYIREGLLPADDQCFGYKTQLVAGGSLQPTNVYVATTGAYVSFMGDFHNQIKDVADGETVVIKVVNQKVIQ